MAFSVKPEYFLDIEAYLAHQVNTLCETKMPALDILRPPVFNESIGIPLLIVHKKNLPAHLQKERQQYHSEYYMVDFRDFLEYATSALPNKFEIPDFPDRTIHYYQAFPHSSNEPLITGKYSSFSVMGACIGRHDNSLWINMQFRVFFDSMREDEFEAHDLVGGNSGCIHEFVNLHLVDYRERAMSREFLRLAQEKGVIASARNDSTPVEFTKSYIIPPFDSTIDFYNSTEYRITYSGQLWTDRAENMALTQWNAGAPEELKQMFAQEKENVKKYAERHSTILADNFEVARLLVHLPGYLRFMYDLVLPKRLPVGALISGLRSGTRKKRKEKGVTYKTLKSLRVSYEAEEEARKSFNVSPRTWTAPKHRYAVRGHWRTLPHPGWKGHDEGGDQVLGRTWIKDYSKGGIAELYEVEETQPTVVIKLKQTLSYARDVITAHEKDNEDHRQIQNQTTPMPAVRSDLPTSLSSDDRPTDEWIYEERCKLNAGLRWLILRRDNFHCRDCGRGAEDGVKLEVDHILPVSKWGRTEERNLRTTCKDCNRGKAARLP